MSKWPSAVTQPMTKPQSHYPVNLEQAASDFARDGYVVIRGLAHQEKCEQIRREVEAALNPPLGPLEYEAELGYPGAPETMDATGGLTPRRLLHAYSRGQLFREWAGSEQLLGYLRLFLGEQPQLVQSHHNCIMTKFPDYGSETGWHQDIRYWRYQRPELVNAWLALGDEYAENGGMRVVPGSHKLQLQPEQFDQATFFRDDLVENQAVLKNAINVELKQGDVLFFHCQLLHAAGRNQSTQTKLSLVFTYNTSDNASLPDTRSARLPQVAL